MSLIIAKVHQTEIQIQSDTQITFHDTKQNFLLGKIKAIIINEKLAICFAGNVNNGVSFFEQIEKLQDELDENIKVLDVISIGLNINNESSDSVSFIICSLEPKIEIIKIEDFKIERDLTNAWIGDKKGFEKFQKHFLPMINSGLKEKLGFEYIFNSSFGEVVNTIDSIGGLQISIRVNNGKFQYSAISRKSMSIESNMEYMNQGIDPIEVDVPPIVENGDFQLEALNSENKFAIGLYYSLGNFGLLIFPKHRNKIIKIKAKSIDEFIAKVLNEYNIELKK